MNAVAEVILHSDYPDAPGRLQMFHVFGKSFLPIGTKLFAAPPADRCDALVAIADRLDHVTGIDDECEWRNEVGAIAADLRAIIAKYKEVL